LPGWNKGVREKHKAGPPVINSHGNFEGFDDLLCNSHKIKSLLHKLRLDRAAGKDGIFAERIFMLIQVCAIT